MYPTLINRIVLIPWSKATLGVDKATASACKATLSPHKATPPRIKATPFGIRRRKSPGQCDKCDKSYSRAGIMLNAKRCSRFSFATANIN